MFITYQITHRASKRFYIGKTNLADWNSGYMGSGKLIKQAVAKYGAKAFYRAILNTFKTEEEAYADEAFRVDLETITDPLCYNICSGGDGVGSGKGHPCYGTTRPDNLLRNKNKVGSRHPNWKSEGKQLPLPLYENHNMGPNNPMYGTKRPNMLWYHDAHTGKNTRIVSGNKIPAGYIRGRCPK